MLERLTSKDYRVIAVCAVVALLSLYVILNYFYKAFPEASIDFKVTQKQSQQIADEWLAKLGLKVAGYRHAAVFNYDDEAKTFLEKELGAEAANGIMGSQVRLWRYSHRWYRALQKEEFSVRISPKGEFLGFSHEIAEEQEGAHLPTGTARNLAAEFMRTTVGIDTTHLEFVEHSQNERPKRLDHSFVWKRSGFEVQGADYRFRVGVQGDRVDAFAEFLHVPEKWSRDYEKLRAKNETTGVASSLFLLLTILAMLVMFIVHIRYRDIRWKTALIFGLVATALSLLTSLNNLPIDMYGYPTTDPFSSLITRTLLSDFLQALSLGMLIFFLTAAAEPLYREQYPRMPSLTNLFRWRGMRSKHFFIAMVVGLAMTFFFGAYQIVFYLASKKFGGWAPQDIPYDNMLNTAFPWVFVLFMGFFPSVSEEFMSRMFSIPFLQKYLRVRWLALLIPAFIWGFAHANYPQQPFYIRGLEVGLAGVLIGVIMLRFGILATLVWHYCVDALYTAVLLIRSGNLYFILTAAVGCGLLLAPLLIAWIAYLRKGGFQSETDLSNAEEGLQRVESQPELQSPEWPAISYQRLPLNRIAWGLLIGLVLCLLYLVPVTKVGEFVKFSTAKAEAEKAALLFAEQNQFDLKEYERVTSVSERFDPITAKYILEKADLDRLNQLYEKESKGSRWQVRFFKPLQREEYRIYLDPVDLSLVSFSRQVEEEAPGATIAQDSARTIATAFAQAHGVRVEEMELKEATEEKRKNRSDHSFTWEAHEGDPRNLAELKYRCQVEIQGDVPALFTAFPKIPETYIRDREKRTLLNNLLIGLRILVIGGLLGLAILQLVRKIRQGEIKWKKALLWAIPISLLVLLEGLTLVHQRLASYPTSISIDLFRITVLIGILIAGIGIYVAATLILALCFALYPTVEQLFHKAVRRSLAFDAVVAAVIAVLFQIGFQRLHDWLVAHFHHLVQISGLGLPSAIDSPLPWLSALNDGLTSGLFSAGLIGIGVYLAKTYLPNKRWWPLLILVLLIAFIPVSVHNAGEIAVAGMLSIVSILWIGFVAVWFGRDNLLFYPLAFFMISLLRAAIEFLRQDQSWLSWNGIGLIGLLLIVVIWLLWPTLRKTTT